MVYILGAFLLFGWVELRLLKSKSHRVIFIVCWLIFLAYELLFESMDSMMPFPYLGIQATLGWLNQMFSFKS